MVRHWNCASALCHNSRRTKGVRYYNLPVDPELRRKYQLVLKNENVNWTKQVICSAHWIKGERLSPDDIPDVICSKEQQKKFESLLKKTPGKSLKKKVACVDRALVGMCRKRRPKNEDLRPKTLWSKTKTLWSKTKTLWSKTEIHWSKTKTQWSKTKTRWSKTKNHWSETSFSSGKDFTRTLR